MAILLLTLTIAHSRLLGCQVCCELPDSASPVSRGPRYVISSPESYLYISTRDGTVRRPNLAARGPRVCVCYYPWVAANLDFHFQPCTAWRRILSMFYVNLVDVCVMCMLHVSRPSWPRSENDVLGLSSRRGEETWRSKPHRVHDRLGVKCEAQQRASAACLL